MPPGFITTIAPPYPPHTVQGAEGAVPLPEQLAADIELEFGVKFGKAHTERGPVLGRKDREEAVNRADVSTRKGARVYQESDTEQQSGTAEGLQGQDHSGDPGGCQAECN